MSWSSRRQLYIISGILLILILAIGIPVYKYVIYKPETCNDGKKNQNETGVDCGGSCQRICKASAADIVVHWRKAFKVSDGVYSAAAQIENLNATYVTFDVPYTFKLIDKNNVTIAERSGTIFVPPHKTFVVFEPNLNTGTNQPQTVYFAIGKGVSWHEVVYQEPSIQIVDEVLTGIATSSSVSFASSTSATSSSISSTTLKLSSGVELIPRYTASLANNTYYPIENIEATAVLYDKNDNAVAVSKTVIDKVDAESKRPIIFTWPHQFDRVVVKKEIVLTFQPTLDFKNKVINSELVQ